MDSENHVPSISEAGHVISAELSTTTDKSHDAGQASIVEESPVDIGNDNDTTEITAESTFSARDVENPSPITSESVRENYFRKSTVKECVDCIENYTKMKKDCPDTDGGHANTSLVSHRHRLVEQALQQLRRDLVSVICPQA